jgi:hypothetical protein
MPSGSDRHEELAGELIEWREGLCHRIQRRPILGGLFNEYERAA